MRGMRPRGEAGGMNLCHGSARLGKMAKFARTLLRLGAECVNQIVRSKAEWLLSQDALHQGHERPL
jgi:hypothetical protein